MTAPVPASILLSTERPPWLPEWSSFAAAQRETALPEAVVARAKLVLLDSIGVIAAGMHEPEVRALARRLATGTGVPIVGTDLRASPDRAALLGGIAGTTLELDEGNQFARGHPAIHVVPALLAAGGGHSGTALLTALVLGYELGARIGIASRLRVAMHPHGTWGTAGAALAIASLESGSAEAIANTVNLAAGLSLATSRRTMLEGATVRNAFAGLSNQLGMLAWDLHKAGFAGERDAVASVYDGVVAEGFDAAVMIDALGSRWEIARNYFKMHAACRYTHAALDVVQTLAGTGAARLVPDDISAVTVDTYSWAAQLDFPNPETMLAAKFSIPFAIATTLVNGAPAPAAFRTPALADRPTRDLAQRITVRHDPAMTAALPVERPARVTITLRDGQQLTGETRINHGDTEAPYSPDEIEAKFETLAGPIWGAAEVHQIQGAVRRIDEAPDVSGLIDMLKCSMPAP